MNVCVCRMSGEAIQLDATSTDTIRNLRAMSAERFGLPMADCTLLLGTLVVALDETLANAGAGPYTLAVTPRVLVASAGSDGRLALWDLNTMSLFHEIIHAHNSSIYAMWLDLHALRAITGGLEPLVKVWDLETFQCVGSCAQEAGVLALHGCFQGGCFVCAGDNYFNVLQMDDCGAFTVVSRRSVDFDVRCIRADFGAAPTVVLYGGHGGLLMCTSGLVEDAQERRQLTAEHTQCLEVDFARRRAVSGHATPFAVKVWDLDARRCLQELLGHRLCVRGLCVDWERNLVASAGFDSELRLWDLGDGSCVASAQRGSSGFNAVTWGSSAAEDVVVTAGNDHAVVVWSLPDLQERVVLRAHTADCWSVK